MNFGTLYEMILFMNQNKLAMKSLIISSFFVLGLASLNYGKPIYDIYSVKDQVVTERSFSSCNPAVSHEIAFEAVVDTNNLMPADKAHLNEIPEDTEVVSAKSIHRMKMKTVSEANISDSARDEEKVFNEKLEERSTEQYWNEPAGKEISDPPENDFYNFQMKIPRNVSVLINAAGKEQLSQ